MATVTRETSPFNHEETQRRVRHPLQLLRGYIRRYIILEGVALTLLVASLLFWVGLAFDFGLFLFNVPLLGVHGIDWILELNDIDPSGGSSFGIRVIIITVVVVGLLALGLTRVVLRWFREFNDNALALVLERRFRKELGDRLITAVELADPALAKKYGFSQAMVEKTISEAVETLKRLPVADVFNWGRLTRLWLLLGASTVGVWLVVMALCCVGSFFTASPMTPLDFGWKFYDVASIWGERNLLLMNTYWPRSAYLEIGRFPAGKTEMRVARDDARPDLHVRAFEWVIADRKAPHGWRALTWKDLSEKKLVDQALLSRVTIPRDFAAWQLDVDDLEPNLVAALFVGETPSRKSGELRAHLSKEAMQKKIAERGAENEVARWLDWQEWSMDQIGQQMEETEVRTELREVADYDALDEIFKQLKEKAAAPSMSRTLRKLVIPAEVAVTFRGEETGYNDVFKKHDGNKYVVPLDALKDSTNFKFRARGEDFYTQPKMIVLVAAPTAAAIAIDKDEPAYIYLRLNQEDQMPLAGQRHITEKQALSTTGDTNTIEVPLGANLVIHVQTDRKLRGERAVFVKDPSVLPEGYAAFPGKVRVDDDNKGFAIELKNLTRKHSFDVEFFDEDNIRGKRRFKILSIADTEPQLGNLNLFNVLLRKPKFKAPAPSEKEKERDPRDLRELAELAGAYLITPEAILPFECPVKDDYGLVKVGYHYKIRQIDFELTGLGGGAKKSAGVEVDQATRRYRMGLIVSNFQFLPGNPLSAHLGAPHIALTTELLQQDIRQAQGFSEAFVGAEGFPDLLERRSDRMILPAEIARFLKGGRPPQAWEFDFKDDRNKAGEIGFDVRKHLPKLKEVDLEKFGQTHYFLQVAVQATDNNVETGAIYLGDKGKELRGNTKKNRNGYVNFLVISENELLAQISLEEELISEKLEGAKEKVDAGIVSLQEQLAKITRDPKTADMENVLNRMNEIRTALSTAGNHLRESHLAYRNILNELSVNRVRAERRDRIRDKIVDPLENIVFENPVFPGSGSHPLAEAAFQNALQLVEKDVNDKAEPNAVSHERNMLDAGKSLNKLSYDIKLLLDAMGEGIIESKLIALLAGIERTQNEKTRLLRKLWQDEVQRNIEMLINPKGKDKKEDKGPEEKKTGRGPSATNSLALSASEGMAGYLLWDGVTARDTAIPSLALRVGEQWFMPESAGTPTYVFAMPHATLEMDALDRPARQMM